MDILTNELAEIREKLKKHGLMAPIDFGFNPSSIADYLATGLVIPMDQMENDASYIGFSKGSNVGIWNASESNFTVSTPIDGGTPIAMPVNHFENYDGVNVFIPVRKL